MGLKRLTILGPKDSEIKQNNLVLYPKSVGGCRGRVGEKRQAPSSEIMATHFRLKSLLPSKMDLKALSHSDAKWLVQTTLYIGVP
jgi:hypothetical protein